jgi:hypothetical protein
MKVTAFTSAYWDCPACQQRAFLRDVVLKFDETVVVGPEDPLDCPACGYSLSEDESRPTRNGGVLRGGWWFTCPGCYRDSFTAISLYETDSLGQIMAKRPPVVQCQWCKQEAQVRPRED